MIEKSLSVDNIFVFVLVFAAFGIPPLYQHRVLFWGVLGALVMRAVFIAAGAALLAKFHWVIYLFGGLLALTGIKMLVFKTEAEDPSQSPFVRLAKRWIPVTDQLEQKDWKLQREIVKKCGGLGLFGTNIPEAYGGVDLDKISTLVVSEAIAKLELLRAKGPTKDAFTFRRAFPPPDAAQPSAPFELGDECPAT